MALSNQQYRDIMKDYDDIRMKNYRLSSERARIAQAKIPEIREINEQMASLTGSRVRELLYRKEDPNRPDNPDSPDRAAVEADHRQQIQALSAKKKALLKDHGYPEDWLDPLYDCPDCRDTGYIGDKKCHCFLDKITDLLYGQSNMDSVLAEENFHHFRTDYYPDRLEGESISPRDNMEEILQTSFDFIRHFGKESEAGRNAKQKNLLIFGNTGVGKSFLSHCIADALLKEGHSVLYLSAHRLFEILAEHTFHRENADSSANDLIYSCELLIIDDLGTEMNNAFVNSSLFTCLNERLQSGVSTIINTNLSLEQISHTYSERIFSRLLESYIPLHIIGEDIRLKIALSSLD